jgi:hypothetical protein
MAKFFSHGGVKSICSCPTATTGDPFGAGQSGHELPHAERGGGGQHARDSAQARPAAWPGHRWDPVRSPSCHVLYSLRPGAGFAGPGDRFQP